MLLTCEAGLVDCEWVAWLNYIYVVVNLFCDATDLLNYEWKLVYGSLTCWIWWIMIRYGFWQQYAFWVAFWLVFCSICATWLMVLLDLVYCLLIFANWLQNSYEVVCLANKTWWVARSLWFCSICNMVPFITSVSCGSLVQVICRSGGLHQVVRCFWLWVCIALSLGLACVQVWIRPWLGCGMVMVQTWFKPCALFCSNSDFIHVCISSSFVGIALWRVVVESRQHDDQFRL